MTESIEALTPGTQMPTLNTPPIDRATLQRYADASGDHHSIHLDSEVARAMGFPDVIAHGLLVMAYLGRAVTGWIPSGEVRDFDCRFIAVTNLGDSLDCSGTVTTISEVGLERLTEFDVQVVNQSGEVKLKGTATVAESVRAD